MVGAVDKHLALIGFMGAGKSKLGRELARLTGRPFVDTDEEIEKRFGPIGELFERGEPEFRRIEEQIVAEALAGPTAVIALGGGAVLSEATRERLAQTTFVAWVPVDVDTAWSRVRSSDRPLARDRERFGRLYEERVAIYDAVADGSGDDARVAPPLRARHRLLEPGPLRRGVHRRRARRRTPRAPASSPGALDAPRAERRGGEDVGRRRAALERARDRTRRMDRRLRRRIDDRRRRVRCRDAPPRRSLGCGADHARGDGRRRDRREDRDQHRGWEEPRRRVSLPAAGLRRPELPLDAAG